jgi:hypothetical protein
LIFLCIIFLYHKKHFEELGIAKKIIAILFAISIVIFCGCKAASELAEINTTVYITGKVLDKITLAPITGATVYVRSGDTYLTATTISDDTATSGLNEGGSFVIDGLIARGKDLSITISGTDYQSYISSFSSMASTDELVAIRQLDLGNILLVKPSATITGYVLGFSGPLSGVTIVAENLTSPEAGLYRAETTSDANGAFSFSSVPATSMTVYNLPVDVDADSLYDYGSVTDSLDLSRVGASVERTAFLVLQTFEEPFDLIFSNIEDTYTVNNQDYDYGTMILNASTSSILLYYNKNVTDDNTLVVNCTDDFVSSNIIPVSTSVEGIKVTVTSLEGFVLGHTTVAW